MGKKMHKRFVIFASKALACTGETFQTMRELASEGNILAAMMWRLWVASVLVCSK